MRPSTMMFRNLMAMDVEESIRANPLDGVVLLCGCDKTTPAQLMGAASADLPAIMVTGGPMLKGIWRNREVGSGTDVWRYWDELRAGRISEEEWCEIECSMSRSAGHCMVMGTASTMTSLAEALGMTLTGCANIPAADSRRYEIAQRSGEEDRRDGWRRPEAVENPDSRGARKRGPRRYGHRRLDQRDHPPEGARRASGDCLSARPLRRDFARDSRCRQHQAVGQAPDGGYVLRGRRSGGDERLARPPARRRHDGDGQDDCGKCRRRPVP